MYEVIYILGKIVLLFHLWSRFVQKSNQQVNLHTHTCMYVLCY